MRQTIYAVVMLVLLAGLAGAGWLWWTSFQRSDQLVVRLDLPQLWQRWRGGDEAGDDSAAPAQDPADPELAQTLTVWTSDRGRLSMLWLALPTTPHSTTPGGRDWAHEVAGWARQSNPTPAPDQPRLDQACADHGLGFGFDRDVQVADPESPAVSAVLAGQPVGRPSDATPATPADLPSPAVAGVGSEGGAGGTGGTGGWALRRVVVPWWAVVAAVGGLCLVWTMTFGVRVLREGRGRCVRCGHDVSQSSHYCPSCRKPIPRRTWSGDTRPRRAGRIEQVPASSLERRR